VPRAHACPGDVFVVSGWVGLGWLGCALTKMNPILVKRDTKYVQNHRPREASPHISKREKKLEHAAEKLHDDVCYGNTRNLHPSTGNGK